MMSMSPNQVNNWCNEFNSLQFWENNFTHQPSSTYEEDNDKKKEKNHEKSFFTKMFTIQLMATRNPVNSPVEVGNVGSLSHYLQGFCYASGVPSTVSTPPSSGGWKNQETGAAQAARPPEMSY